MKKATLLLMVICMFLAVYPLSANAETTKVPPVSTVEAPKPPESAEAKALLLRLDEIKAIDKSELSSPQKQALRKEVRTIKHKLNEIGDGLYLSAGAIIIIILLLIIIF